MSAVSIQPAETQRLYSEAEINSLIDKKVAQRAGQCCACTGVVLSSLLGYLFLYLGAEDRRKYGSHDPTHIAPTMGGIMFSSIGVAGVVAMVDWNWVSQKIQDIGARARIISNIAYQGYQEYIQRTSEPQKEPVANNQV